MAVLVGDKAPGFTLYDTDRKPRALSEFSGKNIVLAFFPGAFTGVCTKEMCTLRDSMAAFNAANAQVIGVSVDAPAANKGFATANGLSFPVLSDYTHKVSEQYAGLYKDFGGLPGLAAAKRSVFVIDRDGVVRYTWSTENPGTEPPYDEVQNAVKQLG